MPAELHTPRLTVLSDLHLAPAGEQCVFAAHEALVGLIDHLIANPPAGGPQWLLLNGDVFDFLQIPGYGELSLPLAPQRMAAILDDLDHEPASRNIVQALRRFTTAGHGLCCRAGNHDAELNLASVQEMLAKRLGASNPWLPTASHWRVQAGGYTVQGLHGHHDDAFNAIGGEQMAQAQGAGAPEVPLPPGSRLVCQVINPFRRARAPDGKRRFPFIDRLPSDQAVVLAVMLLDPALAGRHLGPAIGIGAAALLRRALAATGMGGPTLASAGTSAPSAPATPGWTSELVEHLAGAADSAATQQQRQLLEHGLEAYFASPITPGPAAHTLAAGSTPVHQWLWGALGRSLRAAAASFRCNQPDALARDTMAGWGERVVALTGHTHAPKSLLTPSAGHYLNTGTWVDQVLPPTDTAPGPLQHWLDRLQRDELPTWNGHPVAQVDAQGPRLLHWDGVALQPWRDPQA